MGLRRVVVTGLGALTPIGNTISEYWQGLIGGKSGAAPITYFDASLFKKINFLEFVIGVKNSVLEDNWIHIFLKQGEKN